MEFAKANGHHVLLVEDDRLTRMVVQDCLKQVGFQVDVASNGEDAILKLEQARKSSRTSITMILTDLVMPKVSGEELFKRLQRSERFRHIPIVVMSSNDDTQTVERFLSNGAAQYLVKPVSKDKLAGLRSVADGSGGRMAPGAAGDDDDAQTDASGDSQRTISNHDMTEADTAGSLLLHPSDATAPAELLRACMAKAARDSQKRPADVDAGAATRASREQRDGRKAQRTCKGGGEGAVQCSGISSPSRSTRTQSAAAAAAVATDTANAGAGSAAAAAPTVPATFPLGAPSASRESRKAALARFREKKAQRKFTPKVRYAARKKLAEARPRYKGQFIKLEALPAGTAPDAAAGEAAAAAAAAPAAAAAVAAPAVK